MDRQPHTQKIGHSLEAMRPLFHELRVEGTHLAPLPDVIPDYPAPIVRRGEEGYELGTARRGLPTPPQYLVTKTGKPRRTDSGVTNLRTTASPHWRRWLGVDNRCLVPFSRFAESVRESNLNSRDVWFELVQESERGFFAGVWVPEWTSVRKLAEGPVTVAVRIPYHGTERAGPRSAFEGDAGDPDEARGLGDLPDGALAGGEGPAASAAGRLLADRGACCSVKGGRSSERCALPRTRNRLWL